VRIFSVIGITKSGKTTTVENLIWELTRRRHRVGSIKEIHFEDFVIDLEGSNTHRHKEAGSLLVTARGYFETDLLFPVALSLEQILSYYDHDFVVMEGVSKTCAPKIITAHTTAEVDERLDGTVFAISGVLSNEMKEYRGIPVINAINQTQLITDLVEEKIFRRLPDMDPACCQACGYTCRELCARILKGESLRSECILDRPAIRLCVNGRDITMVPFVQKLLRNAVLGVVGELEGYRKNAEISIEVKEEFHTNRP